MNVPTSVARVLKLEEKNSEANGFGGINLVKACLANKNIL